METEKAVNTIKNLFILTRLLILQCYLSHFLIFLGQCALEITTVT